MADARPPRLSAVIVCYGGRGLSSAAEMERFVGRRKAALRFAEAGAEAGATEADATEAGATEAGGG